MRPKEVQSVEKVKGKNNIIVLTFYGSSVQHYVEIGPFTFEWNHLWTTLFKVAGIMNLHMVRKNAPNPLDVATSLN